MGGEQRGRRINGIGNQEMMLLLDGVRVLTVEQYGAGPFGTMWLADQGAEVIKIEAPEGGDFARVLGPYFFDNGDSQWFHAYNRNKKSLTLDLKSEQGQAVFHDLVKTADAVTSNLRGDVPEKLGLTYGRLKAHNRSLVCAHLSAYGRNGPRASWPGFDYLMQAEAGWFSLTGDPGQPPTRFGLSVVDQMTGVALAYAALCGIIRARASGEGGDVDVSLFDVALSNLGYPAIWYLNNGPAQPQVHVLGRDAGTQGAGDLDAHGFRHPDPDFAGGQHAGHFGGADADHEGAEGAGGGRVAVGADAEHPRPHVAAFRQDDMADAPVLDEVLDAVAGAPFVGLALHRLARLVGLVDVMVGDDHQLGYVPNRHPQFVQLLAGHAGSGRIVHHGEVHGAGDDFAGLDGIGAGGPGDDFFR